MHNLNIISVNVRGLNSYEKRNKFYIWLEQNRFDVVLLQETHFIEKYKDNYDSRWNGNCIHAFSDSPYSRGVSILFRKELNVDILNVHKSEDARKLLVNVKIDDTLITFINVYAPNTEKARIEFFNRLRSFTSTHTILGSKVFLCGDFNCSFEKKNDKSQKRLSEILHKLDLVDIWKHKYPDKNGFTWCDADNCPKNRIDYIFVSNEILDLTKNMIIRRIPGTHNKNTRMSDHRYLKACVDLNKLERGSGYWKLNISHLEHDEYKKGIIDIFKDLDKSLDSISRWELFKVKIRDFSINYAKQSKNNIKLRIKLTEDKIEEIENLPSALINMNEKRTLEKELDDMYNQIAKGAQIRSKAQWIGQGERNTNFFLSMEKKNQINNTIYEINNDNGTFSSNSEILNEMCNFYEKLYKSTSIEDNNISNYLNDIHCPTLDENEKQNLDTLPSIDECKEAVFNMKNNKSPGLDGIPCEFYKCFWCHIGSLFYEVLLSIFDN